MMRMGFVGQAVGRCCARIDGAVAMATSANAAKRRVTCFNDVSPIAPHDACLCRRLMNRLRFALVRRLLPIRATAGNCMLAPADPGHQLLPVHGH
jgi:hypothetical protein